MEWTNDSRYNSFNSYKGLTYYENYKAIAAWMSGNQYLPAPIECNLDIFAECNLACYFCVGQRYLRTNRTEVGEMRVLPTDYMFRLTDFLVSWGVRGLCISGGGEPTLHEALPHLIRHAAGKMDVAVVTNATRISSDLAHALMQCKWVALSVDAGDPQTYTTVKGKDMFNEVVQNISQLVRLRNGIEPVDLCFKFLLLPENIRSMHKACKLAKELGVQDFHARPVDFERSDIAGHRKLELDRLAILEEFEKCHEEETKDFHVYTVTHKFDSDFHVKHVFAKCLATPLVIPILQDGNAYICVDKKMERPYKLGSCYPDPESIFTWWGSDYHRDVVKSVDIGLCSRCTWSEYNRQVEETVLKDKMCLSFP